VGNTKISRDVINIQIGRNNVKLKKNTTKSFFWLVKFLMNQINAHFLAQAAQFLMLFQHQRHQPNLVRQRVAAVVDGGDVLAGAWAALGCGRGGLF
jgi:hypothetical protein